MQPSLRNERIVREEYALPGTRADEQLAPSRTASFKTASIRCGSHCQCSGCKNEEHNRAEIAQAIEIDEKRRQKRPAPSPKYAFTTSDGNFLTPIKSSSSRCTCKDGICTSDCPCLVGRGECGTNCPCLGCRALQEKTKGCSCKKPHCLKLYCECLAAQKYCDARCHCGGCKNTMSTEVDRTKAIAAILERNPSAFQPKVVANGSKTNNLHHLRGCNCRKSNCLKNYCECHQAGVSCTNRCACHKCRNTEEFHSAKKMLILSAVAKKQSPAHDLVSGSTGRRRRHSRQLSFDEAPAPSCRDTSLLSNLRRKRSIDGFGRVENRNVTFGKAPGVPEDSNSIFIERIHDLARGNATTLHAQSVSTIENLIKTQFEDLNEATSLQHLTQTLLAAAISSESKASITNHQLQVGCSASHIVQHERDDFTDLGSSLFCHEGSIDSIDTPSVEVRAKCTTRPHEAMTEGAVLQDFRDFIRSLSDEQ